MTRIALFILAVLALSANTFAQGQPDPIETVHGLGYRVTEPSHV